VETYKERQREHDDMVAKVRSELAVKASNFGKLEAAFKKVIEATGQRVQSLDLDVKNLEQLMAKGLTTRKTLEDRRLELTEAQQRRIDSQNEILKLHAQKSDLETQREHELQQAEFAQEVHGFTATRHQREVGTGYFDAVATILGEGQSSTTAMAGSTERAQF